MSFAPMNERTSLVGKFEKKNKRVVLEKDGVRRTIPTGFSWTYLFLGVNVAYSRKDRQGIWHFNLFTIITIIIVSSIYCIVFYIDSGNSYLLSLIASLGDSLKIHSDFGAYILIFLYAILFLSPFIISIILYIYLFPMSYNESHRKRLLEQGWVEVTTENNQTE